MELMYSITCCFIFGNKSHKWEVFPRGLEPGPLTPDVSGYLHQLGTSESSSFAFWNDNTRYPGLPVRWNKGLRSVWLREDAGKRGNRVQEPPRLWLFTPLVNRPTPSSGGWWSVRMEHERNTGRASCPCVYRQIICFNEKKACMFLLFKPVNVHPPLHNCSKTSSAFYIYLKFCTCTTFWTHYIL